MDSADDLTFRIIFTGDGAGRLRDQVKEKLKEFMGDYTDDTLVEYVIVLLKNGRRKEEARNELNVFLGDESDSFVSWLWDHLRSNLKLYAQSKESCPDEVAQKPESGKEDGKSDLPQLHSETEGIKSDRLSNSKSRRSKDWKGVIRDPDEPPPLRSTVIANIHVEDRSHQSGSHMKRSPSPQPVNQRKRGRSGERGQNDERGQIDERSQVKREAASKPTIDASRRLLQFAVRDAVATSRTTGLTSERSLKRLRSVVSTPADDSLLEERRPKIRSVARVPKAMAVAIKAVADAAKDVIKVKPSGNVFDRLSRSMDVPDTVDQFTEYREAADEDDGKHEVFTRITEATAPTYSEQNDYSRQYVGDMTMLEHDAGITSDFAYNNEGYNINTLDHRIKLDPQIGKSGGHLGNDSMMHYNATNVLDGTANKLHRDQNTPVAMANSSSKTVNIYSNVNTWKPPQYQYPRGVSDMDDRKLVQETQFGAGNYGLQVIKNNSNPLTVGDGNGASTVHAQSGTQQTQPSIGTYPTGRPTEDVDSRTIFVSNVHFAATKDSLSRHFNKFGDVLKVVIITEAATGQPKGSAYVEFMRKEAAENALSLDGTSFMLRILKVVRKPSAQQEATPAATTRPHVSRASPFTASRFGRVPFPRGIPSVYRSRLPIKTGARSLQWKRDVQNSSSESIHSPAAISSPTTRGLTYVRTEAKTDGNFNNA